MNLHSSADDSNPHHDSCCGQGHPQLSFQPNGTLHVDIDHIVSSKYWIGKPTTAHNSPFQPPGTQSYAQQSIANRTPSAATLATNHGQHESDDLIAVIHQVIKLKITQLAKGPGKHVVPADTTTHSITNTCNDCNDDNDDAATPNKPQLPVRPH